MGFDDKAKDTVIHHIGAARAGIRRTADTPLPKRDALEPDALERDTLAGQDGLDGHDRTGAPAAGDRDGAKRGEGASEG